MTNVLHDILNINLLIFVLKFINMSNKFWNGSFVLFFAVTPMLTSDSNISRSTYIIIIANNIVMEIK